jgi:hypothetical protein
MGTLLLLAPVSSGKEGTGWGVSRVCRVYDVRGVVRCDVMCAGTR